MVKNKRKALYISLWVIGGLLGILGAASLWVSYHYKGIIKAQLPGLVEKNTNGLYHISYSDISINLITRSFTAKNVRFTADSNKVAELKQNGKCPNITVNFEVPQIHASGIDISLLVKKSTFQCHKITIYNAKTVLNGIPKQKTPSGNTQEKTMIIGAREIDAINPDITYHFVGDSSDYSLRVKGGRIRLLDWKLDTKKGLDTSSFLFAKNSVVNFDSFFYQKKDGPYNVGSAGIGFSTGNRDLTLKHVLIRLTGTKTDFYRKVNEQKEIYDFYLPTVKFAGLNWKDLVNGIKLDADTMSISDPKLELYFSRKYPPTKKSKVGNYPHQLLHSLGLKINIRRLNILNGHFKYTEENEVTNREAVIAFDKVSGTINNATNIDTLIAKNDKCSINLRGKYMNHADMAANFTLVLSDPKGYFSLDGTVKNIDAADITQSSKVLALTEVKSLHMSQLDLHVEGDQTFGKGNVTMLYNDLELAFLKINEETNKPDRKGLGVLSFVANQVALFPANPMPDKEVRTVTTYVKRDAYKGFFNLIWKNIFQGARNTALRTPDLVNNIKEKKNPAKKGILKKIFSKNR